MEVMSLQSPETVRHPMSSGLFNKNQNYVESIQEELDKIFESEFLDKFHTPRYVFNLKEDYPQSSKESLLFKSQLLSSSKLEQQSGEAIEKRASSALPLGHRQRPATVAGFYRKPTPQQYLTRQMSDNPADDDKYGKPTRSSILRNQNRVQSAPAATINERQQQIKKRQDECFKRKPRCTSAQQVYKEIHERQNASINGESIHAFLVGARYNSANYVDKKSIDCYGIYMPRSSPGDCFGRVDKLLAAPKEPRGNHPSQVSFEASSVPSTPRTSMIAVTSEDNERLAAILQMQGVSPGASPDPKLATSFISELASADENSPPEKTLKHKTKNLVFNLQPNSPSKSTAQSMSVDKHSIGGSSNFIVRGTSGNSSNVIVSQRTPSTIPNKHTTPTEPTEKLFLTRDVSFNQLPFVRGKSMSSAASSSTSIHPPSRVSTANSMRSVRRILPVMKGSYPIKFLDKDLGCSLSIKGVDESWLGITARSSTAVHGASRSTVTTQQSLRASTSAPPVSRRQEFNIYQDADDEINDILMGLRPANTDEEDGEESDDEDEFLCRPISTNSSRPKTGKSKQRELLTSNSSVPANTPRPKSPDMYEEESLTLEEHVKSIQNMTPFEDEVIPEEEELVVSKEDLELERAASQTSDPVEHTPLKVTVDINARLNESAVEDSAEDA